MKCKKDKSKHAYKSSDEEPDVLPKKKRKVKKVRKGPKPQKKSQKSKVKFLQRNMNVLQVKVQIKSQKLTKLILVQ